MPILKLKPACKDYLWGGERLRGEYRIQSDCHPLAEAWMLSCHPDGPSVIENGPFAGRTLAEYLQARDGEKTDFPILIKLIDAARDLSIQVHPSDEYALAREGQQGKTEAWLVLDAEPGAFLYYGFRGTPSAEEVAAAAKTGALTDLLQAVPISRGDLFFIPAGTVHAIGAGVLVAEVQQNSNVTYRVFDYDRLGADGKPRPLHLQKALEVMDRCPARRDHDFGGHLVRCPYFTADLLTAPHEEVCGRKGFTSLLVLDGSGVLACGEERVEVRKGDSLFLPAGSGRWELTGTRRVLRTLAGGE